MLNFSSNFKGQCFRTVNGVKDLTLTRCGRLSVAVLAAVFASVGVCAQQPAGGTGPEQTSPNQAPTVSQAAGSAAAQGKSPAIAVQDQDEVGKNSPDALQVVKFGVGDLVQVSVYNVPELATRARVSNSGDIYLPLIDYVHVEGLTQEEAQALIEKRLADGGFVRNPHVTIFVEEASSQGVTIMGDVARPGIYPDIGDHRLYTVISQAGGFTASASRKIAILRRHQSEPIRLDLPRNLADDLSGNIEIQPGDTINVPKAPIIFVVGDVSRPSGLLIDNGQLTVLQALALAGGANRTAKLSDSRIIHKGSNGLTQTRVEIKKMLEAKAPDIPLQEDDILFIPVNGKKIAATRAIDTAVSAALAISIYTVHP